ncbi:hypothetical protein [Chryseobacterium sp. JK1]|uniref:hypothetical protein n=1 Tax=Chryseobacterium sp. JK1 TaxID=874294 RepID=UPI003D69A467
MNNFEVRVANKKVTVFGFIGAILLCGILYLWGSEMKYTTQQTYMMIVGLSLYVLIMYRVNLKKSQIVNFNFNNNGDMVIRENESILQEVYDINSYYYKNIIPRKFGFLLYVRTHKENHLYYIVSKDLATYKKSDSDNVDQLSNCIDTLFKGKKNRNVIVDFIAYLPPLLILISIIVVISVLYGINTQ